MAGHPGADVKVDAYLDRIRYRGPRDANAATLRDLQLAHLLTAPFENLSIHAEEPIVLRDEAARPYLRRLHRSLPLAPDVAGVPLPQEPGVLAGNARGAPDAERHEADRDHSERRAAGAHGGERGRAHPAAGGAFRRREPWHTLTQCGSQRIVDPWQDERHSMSR